MNKASKLAKQLHEKILEAFPQVIDWKKSQKSVQKPSETVFDYYDRFENVFKQHSVTDEVRDYTSVILNSAFVEGLQDELEQQAKNITT